MRPRLPIHGVTARGFVLLRVFLGALVTLGILAGAVGEARVWVLFRFVICARSSGIEALGAV